MATLFKADGSRLEMAPAKDGHFSLKELQEAVGGYIEMVWLSPKLVMVCNEEGKLMGLPYNAVATQMFHYHTKRSDLIVGDVLVCKYTEVR